MIVPKRSFRTALVIVGALMIAGCSQTTPPAEVPSASSTSAGSTIPAGWATYPGDGFTIALPPTWQLTEPDAQPRGDKEYLFTATEPQLGVGLTITAEQGRPATEAAAEAFGTAAEEKLLAKGAQEAFVSAADEVTAGPAWVLVSRTKINGTTVLFPMVLIPAEPASYRLTFVQGDQVAFGADEMKQIANTFVITGAPESEPSEGAPAP